MQMEMKMSEKKDEVYCSVARSSWDGIVNTYAKKPYVDKGGHQKGLLN